QPAPRGALAAARASSRRSPSTRVTEKRPRESPDAVMDGDGRRPVPGSRAGPPTPSVGTLPQPVEAAVRNGAVPWKGLAFCAALFLFALLSKETALALAPVLVCAAWLAGWRGPKLIAASLTAL